MEVVATISTRLFCLSVELKLRTKDKDSSSLPAWWVPMTMLPALLASLLHATVIRPLAVVATRHHCLNKLEETSCSTWLRVLSKVTSQALRVLLSEQTSLWLLYLLAPHLFDINVKFKVEVGTLHLLLKNTARLLLRLVTGGLRRVRTTSADADADADAAAGGDADDDGGQLPGAREREDGPRRSARHRRPSVRLAGPEWDKRLRLRG